MYKEVMAIAAGNLIPIVQQLFRIHRIWFKIDYVCMGALFTRTRREREREREREGGKERERFARELVTNW